MIEQLSIDLSNYCTKQCPFCYNHSTKEGNVMWKPEEVIAFAKDCVAHGVKAVSLGGGEPFEYDGIYDIIDALTPICYLSVTTNGLHLSWDELAAHKPDKIHISLHDPRGIEVSMVSQYSDMLRKIGIKPGCNILVSKKKLKDDPIRYMMAYDLLTLSKSLKPDQIILIPMRFGDTPTPEDLASITRGEPFQSPSCLLHCQPPDNFASVSWDKKVNFCSYAGGKQPLETLDYSGLVKALEKVEFKSCMRDED